MSCLADLGCSRHDSERKERTRMDVAFPGESPEYRAARDRLLEQEIELRRAMEAVAAARRTLPPVGSTEPPAPRPRAVAPSLTGACTVPVGRRVPASARRRGRPRAPG